MQVRYEIAERWFAIAGKNPDEIQKGIDKDLQPRSFAFPDALQVDANLDVERVVKTVHNVAGYLPGDDRRIRGDRRALRSPGPGRAVFAGAIAGRHDPSRRGR